jgi:hypothetical protein
MAGAAVSAAGRGPVRRAWVPAPLAAHGFDETTVADLTYLVIDEIVDDRVELILSPWPAADEHGRLRFDRLDDSLPVVVDLHELEGLYVRWLERGPRPGDAFAVEVARDVDARAQEGPIPVDDLLVGSVYDISAEARKVAKLAHYASVAEILDDQEVTAWHLDELEDRDPAPAPVREAPTTATSPEGAG